MKAVVPFKVVPGHGISALLSNLQLWAKAALLNEILDSGETLCELFCGHGEHIPLWALAGVKSYVGVDFSTSALEDAQEYWQRCRRPFPAAFINADPCLQQLSLGQLSHAAGFAAVCCHLHIQDCFLAESTARCFLSNVAALLRPDGLFFGLVPDSSTLWYKHQKCAEAASKASSSLPGGAAAAAAALASSATLGPTIRSSLYSITFDHPAPFDINLGSGGKPYGCDRGIYGMSYTLRPSDPGSLPSKSQLVHFPTLKRLAEEAGLKLVDIVNLESLYEDMRPEQRCLMLDTCPTAVHIPADVIPPHALDPASAMHPLPSSSSLPSSVPPGAAATAAGAAGAGASVNGAAVRADKLSEEERRVIGRHIRISNSARDLLSLHAVFIFKRLQASEMLQPPVATKQEKELQADDVAPAGSPALIKAQPPEVPQAGEKKHTSAADRNAKQGRVEANQRHEMKAEEEESKQSFVAPCLIDERLRERKGEDAGRHNESGEGAEQGGVAGRQERKTGTAVAMEVDEAPQGVSEGERGTTGREEEQRMKGEAADLHVTKRMMEGASSVRERGKGKRQGDKGKVEKESSEKADRIKDVPKDSTYSTDERIHEAEAMQRHQVTETQADRQHEGLAPVTFSGKKGKKGVEMKGIEGDQGVRDGKKAGKAAASETGGRKRLSGRATSEQEKSESEVRGGGSGAQLAAVATHEEVTLHVREWEEEEGGMAQLNTLRLQADLQAGSHQRLPDTLLSDPSSVGAKPSWWLLRRSLSQVARSSTIQDQGEGERQPIRAEAASASAVAGSLGGPLSPSVPSSAVWGGVGKKPRSMRRSKSLTFGMLDSGRGEGEGEADVEAEREGQESQRGEREGEGGTLVIALSAALSLKDGAETVDGEAHKDRFIGDSSEKERQESADAKGGGGRIHPIVITYTLRRKGQ